MWHSRVSAVFLRRLAGFGFTVQDGWYRKRSNTTAMIYDTFPRFAWRLTVVKLCGGLHIVF